MLIIHHLSELNINLNLKIYCIINWYDFQKTIKKSLSAENEIQH